MNALAHMATSSPTPMTADAFARVAHVSRETSARLDTYLALLIRWQQSLNLVGRSTLDDPWRRHFWDSAQLHPFIPPGSIVADIGTGAGFPGLVLAILGGISVHLVESDQRKAAFLREAARATGADIVLHVGRAERTTPCAADVVTARAVASVDDLLDLAQPWLRPDGICLFLKGRHADAELAEAQRSWRFSIDRVASRSDPDGVILRLGDISHA